MLFPLALALLLPLQNATIVVATPQQQQPQQTPYVAPYTPMPDPPALPRVDLNSCPFEGCQFGEWTATARVTVYSTWESGRKLIATLEKGDKITALTGVNVVLEPGKGVFDRDVPMYGAAKDETVYMYQNCGEGAVDIWVHARFIKCADLNFSWQGDEGSQKNCDGRWLSLSKSEWWAQIRLKNGTVGWVRVKGNFDGTDALAFLVPSSSDAQG